MPFSNEEQQIIIYGKQQGKNRDEILRALNNYKLGIKTSPVQPQEQGFGSRLSGAFQGGIEQAKQGIQTATTSTNPLEVGAGLTKTAAGVIGAATSPITAAVQPIIEPTLGAAVQKTADVISDIPAVQKFAESKTGQSATMGADFLADLSSVAGTVAGAPLAGRAALSTARSIGQKLTNAIPETGTAGIQKASTLGINSADIMQRVARIQKGKQAKFEQLAKESVGEYLVNRGIFGDVDSISEQLFTRFQKSKATADKQLAQIDGTFKHSSLSTAIKELEKRERAVSTPGAQSNDLKRVIELRNKLDADGLTMSEINELKRLYERNVRVDYIRSAAQNPTNVARSTNVDTAIRNFQFAKANEAGLTNLNQINKETQLAKRLLDDLGAEAAGASGNNAITLTDWIILAGGDASAVGGFFAKKALSSKSVMSSIAKFFAPEAKDADIVPIKEYKPLTGYANWIESIEGRKTPQQQLQGGTELRQSPLPDSKPDKASFNKGANPEQLGQRDLPQDSRAALGLSTQNLINEAKKYKSLEEFVKARGTPVYHGTDVASAGSISKDGFKIMSTGNAESGISLSTNKNISGIFSGKDGRILDVVISPDTRLMAGDEFDAILGKMVREKKMPYKTKQEQAIVDSLAAREAKKLGYDGVDWRGQSEGIESLSDEIRVWNTDKIQTKSQITDIWNKANKAAPEQSLIAEAKKYKSVDDFVKAQNKTATGAKVPDTLKVYALDDKDLGQIYRQSGLKSSAYPADFVAKNDIPELKIKKGDKVSILANDKDAKRFTIENIPERKTESGAYSKSAQIGDLVEGYSRQDQIDFINKNFSKESLTKSQLTDIWNKAHGK